MTYREFYLKVQIDSAFYLQKNIIYLQTNIKLCSCRINLLFNYSLGTPIPGGLHVRHNFQTGVTEAKLMDNEDVKEKDSNENLNSSNTSSLTLHPEKAIFEDKDPVPTEKSDLFNHPIEELKARLKKIKQDSGENIPELDVIALNYD